MTVKVLVTGGRGYTAAGVVWAVLDIFDSQERIDIIVEGGARGVDQFAREWAITKGREVRTCKPDKTKDGAGNEAPKRRNSRMLARERQGLSYGLAFPGGTGTQDMVKKLLEAGVRVTRVVGDGPWYTEPVGLPTISLDRHVRGQLPKDP